MDDLVPSSTARPAADVHDQATIPPGAMASASPLSTVTHLQGMGTGQQLDDYELLEELGRGGMGVVFRARQKSLNRIVAVKLILTGRLASTEEIERFQAEAEAAAMLDHPGIIPIYEVGVFQGQHYFSMAYVAGENLASRVERGPLAPTVAAQYLRQLTDAVAYAHQQKILHRDIKPGNILIDEHQRLRITDFGLARRWEPGADHSSLNDVCGTVSYMPPEQAEGQSQRIGPASDVYALGATLYCLLTGRPPFQSANPIDTLLQVVQQPPVPPRQFNPVIPQDLETICLKCLEKDPARRYDTAVALGEDLQRFLDDQPILARPPSSWEQLRRWSRQHPGLALSGSLTAAAMLTLLLVSVLYNFLLQGEKLQSRAAILEAQRLQQSTQQLLEQLAQLRQSERALEVLQFAEYGRLCVLLHLAEPGESQLRNEKVLRELTAVIDQQRETTDPLLQKDLQDINRMLTEPGRIDDRTWQRLTQQITEHCRRLWHHETDSVPDLRAQVQWVVANRFVNTARQLLRRGGEKSPADTLHQLRELAWGDLAVVGSPETIVSVATFLEPFQPELKPPTSSQLQPSLDVLSADLLSTADPSNAERLSPRETQRYDSER
ncbi:protein kinase [bacterium]|nr:protein kinase [bacterium]